MTSGASHGALTGAPAPDLGPGGQTVAPWAPAQLGLDGRAYAIPAPEVPPEGASPSPSLGPPHGLSLQPGAGAAQLSLFDRLDVAATILGGTLFDRQAKCLRTRIVRNADVPLTRSDRGAWGLAGVVRCGHYTCPSCGPRRARDVAARLGLAIERWLAGDEGQHADDSTLDVWMLSLTIPHRRDDATETTVARLYDAAARLFRSRTWARFVDEWGVRARVRVLDATHAGANGCHPHFHVALFVDGAYPGFRHRGKPSRVASLDALPEAVELVDAWERAVVDAGAPAPARDIGVKLSPSEDAAGYFVKWGLADEVAGSPAKHDSHLRLLDAAGAGDERARAAYLAFRAAVDGRQWVTGVADLCRVVGISDDDVAAYVERLRAERDEAEPPTLVKPLALVVRAPLWRAATQLGLGRVTAIAAAADAAGEDPQLAIDRALWEVVARRRADEAIDGPASSEQARRTDARPPPD